MRRAIERWASSITVEQLDDDPYPIYARMRREAPVCFVPAVGLWFATRWADVELAASRPRLIDSAVTPPLRAMLGPSLHPRVVEGGVQLCLARRGDRWFAFETWCTHAESPLSDGWLEGEGVRCACHGALFSLETGVALEGPAEGPIRVFPAREADGRVGVDLPMLSQ